MVKLCNLNTKFHKVPPFWLNKKQDFSTEVIFLFGEPSYNLLFAWYLFTPWYLCLSLFFF